MRITAILSISIIVGLVIPSSGTAQRRESEASFRFENRSLRESLDSLMKQYPVSIVYLDKDVEGKTISTVCSGCTFEQALNEVLSGTSLTWIRVGSQVILKRREIAQPRPLATICGTVTDSVTGEWVANASVRVITDTGQVARSVQRWCPTNSYGFFSLRRLPPGAYRAEVRALGYRSASFSLIIEEGGSVQRDVEVQPEEITLEEVTVEGVRSALTSAEGFSRGVYIRSVPSDQNQYLLDGARIYDPSHFGNVFSAFNPEVLNDVRVMLEGMPPNYGGAIGGILDLSMRDGTAERLGGSAGTGSLGSHVSLEGPVDDATTFLLSARRGYPDGPVPFLRSYGTQSPLGSSELIAKVSHRLSPGSRLLLSGYLGRDSYSNLVESGGERLYNNFSWGNSAFNLRWIGIVSPATFLHASAVYTRYDFSLGHILSGDPFPSSGASLSSDYIIEDLSARANAEHYYDEEHTFRAGVELVHHRMAGNLSTFSTQIAPLSLQGASSWDLSVYVQDQWRVLPRVTAELGARATNFVGVNSSFSAVDPRFSLLVSIDDDSRAYASLSSINQFIHPYRNSGVFLLYPTVFWYPSSDKVLPTTSLHMTLGFEKGFGENVYLLSAESYYRVTRNLHEFGLGPSRTGNPDLNGMILFGTGKSYGVEVSLRKRTGNLSGSVSYALSLGNNTFAELNGGEPYSPRFARRHELQLDSWYTPWDGWSCGVLCVLTSDEFLSISSQAIKQSIATSKDSLRVTAEPSMYMIDLNGNRTPGFQRLELRVLHSRDLWGMPCQFSLRFLSAYGLIDPFEWDLQKSPDVRLKWSASVKNLKLFPLFPTVGMIVRF